RRGTRRGAPTPAAVARATALDLVDFGGREPEAPRDVGGDDLDDRPLLALVGLPAALFEPAAHDDARALRQRRADVLGELPPGDDIEEAGLLFPVLGLLVAPRPVDGHAERDLRDAAGRVSHLGIPSD